jgi:hypothetical protein
MKGASAAFNQKLKKLLFLFLFSQVFPGTFPLEPIIITVIFRGGHTDDEAIIGLCPILYRN